MALFICRITKRSSRRSNAKISSAISTSKCHLMKWNTRLDTADSYNTRQHRLRSPVKDRIVLKPSTSQRHHPFIMMFFNVHSTIKYSVNMIICDTIGGERERGRVGGMGERGRERGREGGEGERE